MMVIIPRVAVVEDELVDSDGMIEKEVLELEKEELTSPLSI